MEAAHFTVAAALRLGAKVCEPYPCICGSIQDSLGLHALFCKRIPSFGRQSRHAAINDLIQRGPAQGGCPATREPAHLDRDNGKRVDGLTVMPFSMGKCAIWDFTCPDTFARSYRNQVLSNPGGSAKEAERKKSNKYQKFSPEFLFMPVAVETSGVFGETALKFTKEIYNRVRRATGEVRSTHFLRQRIAVEVPRGNARSIMSLVSIGSTTNWADA